MDLLILGGTRHMGRSIIEAAARRGDTVTIVNRGLSGRPPASVDAREADRTRPGALADALGDDRWDAVIDTWAGAPWVARDAARLLRDRTGHYGYVSSRSVYRWPPAPGFDESAPVVDGDQDGTDEKFYPAAKRGAEIAISRVFGERALLARAGLILGPYEDVGRLPWWLRRLSRGGPALAPGPADRPLQYLDGRDLAEWMLAAAERGLGGIFNTVSPPGHTTMGRLLEEVRAATGSVARLVWTDPAVIEAAGIAPWTELPIWTPPTGEMAGLHAGDVTAAAGAGLTCRSVRETVHDTWDWLRVEGEPEHRADRPPVGLDPERERAVLATVEGDGG
ncbi:NAD-dependent epimerase/dehydratase family protein [Streptosporangium sp. DT93]|uniref:NAD-dependent epimerase/dehydratase family protein n=1 Tax=Streptosporangium sp. DT93 TaxID=3393428 RepID=UPI003CE6BE3F